MDKHRGRGDRYGDYPESHRNSHSATSYWPSDGPVPHHGGDFDNHIGGFPGSGHHHLHHRLHHPHFSSEPNESIGSGGEVGSGHYLPISGRKRQFSHPGQGTSPDYIDGGSYVKLYVGAVPRTVTEQDIRSLFEEHGNIVEVILIKDKRTGQQQECCFVKYAKLEEADRAIGALHNHYMFPGGMFPIKVKYADGEQERLGGFGAHVMKLYVGCVNKQASIRDIEEIFSPYGLVEDIYIVRDELKQSRGCAFIQFSRRDMAVAAMNALNGTYLMRGSDQPLIVRFADPKKPRAGESRGNYKFGGSGSGFGPCSQESVVRSVRPASYVSDPMDHQMRRNTSHPISKSSLPETVLPMTNQCQQSAPNFTGQPFLPLQQPHSQLSQMPSRQNMPESSQSLGAVSEFQNQLNMIHLPIQTLEREQSSKATPQQSSQTGSEPVTVSSPSTTLEPVLPSTISSAPAVPTGTETEDPLDCDWSEHICPDGYTYYYNCVTCESKWEKPEEYTFYEQQLQKQQRWPNLPCQRHSPVHLQVPSMQQSEPELDHMRIHAATSAVLAPACV